MRLALSTLCENPARKTGLTTMFRELILHAREHFPDVEWEIFLPRGYPWAALEGVAATTIDVDSGALPARLAADHFLVPLYARQRHCAALITVGFLPRICPLPGAVHILTLHHLDQTNGTGWLRAEYRRRETERALSHAPLVITNSQTAADQLLNLEPSLTERLLISYEGVDHQEFHPHAPPGEAEALQAEIGLPPGYILWVSNFYPYKQLDLLLKAYAALTAEERDQHPLVLVGGDWRNTLSEALELSTTLGIEQNVHFLGWVDERWIAPLYRQAGLHVLASASETFGRSVLEAMACGTPCVVNDIPIMREVTAGSAILTDFTNTEASTEALRRAITDPALYAELRDRSLARASQFSMSKLARERVAAVLKRFG